MCLHPLHTVRQLLWACYWVEKCDLWVRQTFICLSTFCFRHKFASLRPTDNITPLTHSTSLTHEPDYIFITTHTAPPCGYYSLLRHEWTIEQSNLLFFNLFSELPAIIQYIHACYQPEWERVRKKKEKKKKEPWLLKGNSTSKRLSYKN